MLGTFISIGGCPGHIIMGLVGLTTTGRARQALAHGFVLVLVPGLAGVMVRDHIRDLGGNVVRDPIKNRMICLSRGPYVAGLVMFWALPRPCDSKKEI